MNKMEKKLKDVDEKYYEHNKALIDKRWKEIAQIQERAENYRRCKEDIEYFKEMVNLAPNIMAILYDFLETADIDKLLKDNNFNYVIEPDIYSWSFFTSIESTDFIYKAMEYVLGTEKVEKAFEYYNDYQSSFDYDLVRRTAPIEYEIDKYIDEYSDYVDRVLTEEANDLSYVLAYSDNLFNNRYNNRYSIEEYVLYIDLNSWMMSLFILPYYNDEERRNILKRNNKKAKMEMKLSRG